MHKLQGLSKAERLSSRKAIERLFAEGKSLKAYPIRLLYLPLTEAEARASVLPSSSKLADETPRFQVLFSVPKRLVRKAVHRNRIKRQLREAFRLNKANYASELKNYYLIALIYMSREQQPFAQTQDKLKEAFLRLLSTDTSTNSA